MRRRLLVTAAVVGAVLGSTGAAQAVGPTYVGPADIDNDCSESTEWCTFLRDTGTATVGAGLAGPGGTTHLRMSTAAGNDKATVKNRALLAAELTSLTDLQYSFAVTSLGTTPTQAPAINVEIDRNGGALEAGDFATLVYEPLYDDQNGASPAQPIVLDQWQTRVASNGTGEGGWWSPANGTTAGAVGALGFATYTAGWADVLAALPDATILSVAVNQGGGNPGLASEVDLLTTNGTVYDFGTAPVVEPEPTTPKVKDDCKNGGWATFDAPTFRNQGQCVSFVASAGKGATVARK